MAKIKIETTCDEYDCEDCGFSWAEGYTVYIDSEKVLELTPVAHCYAGQHYTLEEVMIEIFKLLGHELEIEY